LVAKIEIRLTQRVFEVEFLLNFIILIFLSFITIAIIKINNLFSLVILTGTYSFLMAILLIVMDAVDVGMTEAAVGAGVSTVLLLSALYLTGSKDSKKTNYNALPILFSFLVGALLIYGMLGLPQYGLSETAFNNYVGALYLERSIPETTIPNVVTSVLASYRGYDTLGEVTVIFTAGIGVLMLLKTFKND
jgi:multicomponent Na+:H+ antiporter subunit B